jgi:hypothetical protein
VEKTLATKLVHMVTRSTGALSTIGDVARGVVRVVPAWLLHGLAPTGRIRITEIG